MKTVGKVKEAFFTISGSAYTPFNYYNQRRTIKGSLHNLMSLDDLLNIDFYNIFVVTEAKKKTRLDNVEVSYR